MKFSIIIPNYNKEKYIKECLDSIFNQTYKNYEVILIDDNSSDNSLEMIKDYDVKLFHTDRLNAGGARNVGLKNATGDYVIFLDSDDYLTNNNVIEKLNNIINEEDIIFLSYTEYKNDQYIEMKEEKEDLSTKIEKTKRLGCPTKCFKRDLIKDIQFAEKKPYEDMNFTLEAMCKANKYTYFDESFFTYRKVENSNTTAEMTGETMVNILEELIKFYKLCLKYPKYKDNILNRIKKDNINKRLEVLSDLIISGENHFFEYF